jgi:hypothetical protein
MTLTVAELREHAHRLQDDLAHKRREIRDRDFSTYDRATLTRQCDALANRVDEILAELEVIDRLQLPQTATA